MDDTKKFIDQIIDEAIEESSRREVAFKNAMRSYDYLIELQALGVIEDASIPVVDYNNCTAHFNVMMRHSMVIHHIELSVSASHS